MTYFGIDAGGTHTNVLVGGNPPERTTWSSVNPASQGTDEVGCRETALFAHLGRRSKELTAGWVASSTVSTVPRPEELAHVRHLLAGHGIDCPVWASNDKVALLFGEQLAGEGCVAVVGTGTGYVARSWAGKMAEVGGVEYLASDEGSAFDLGLQALRRCAAAADGSGPRTLLRELVARRLPGDLPARLRELARQPYPKGVVAAFADLATTAWLAGDDVARRVIEDALTSIVRAVSAVYEQAALEPGARTLLVGGVILGCPPFADTLATRLKRKVGTEVVVCSDPVREVMAAAHWAGPELRSPAPLAAVVTGP